MTSWRVQVDLATVAEDVLDTVVARGAIPAVHRGATSQSPGQAAA